MEMSDESQLCDRAIEVRPWQRGNATATVVSCSVQRGEIG